MPVTPLPPTAAALLRALVDAGGSLPYSDPAVTTSGLTALRHRGLARVDQYPVRRVMLTEAGRIEVIIEGCPLTATKVRP